MTGSARRRTANAARWLLLSATRSGSTGRGTSRSSPFRLREKIRDERQAGRLVGVIACGEERDAS